MKKLQIISLTVASLCVGLVVGWFFGPRRADAALIAQLPPESVAYVSALGNFSKGWTREDIDSFLRDIRTNAKNANASMALSSIFDGVACFSLQELKKAGKHLEMDARMERGVSRMIADYSAGRFAGLPEEKLAQTVFRKLQDQKP